MSSNNGNELDWQGSIGSVRDRVKYLLETGLNSDVEFLVGTGKPSEENEGKEEKQLFKAHKFVLAMSSSIFAAQFRFDESFGSAQNENAPIEIVDIKASAFNAILHFIYTDDLSLLSKENYVEVFYSAKKYLLHVLAQNCVELSATMLDIFNVFDMLRVAKLHQEEILIEDCWSFLDKSLLSAGFHFSIVDVFTSLNREEMGELLERNTLHCGDEYRLFYYLEKWAVKQWEDAGMMDPTGEQLRAAMGDLLFAIRFPLIPPMEFIEKIVPLGILNNAEVSSMLLHYSQIQMKKGHPLLPFSTKPRAIWPREHNKLLDKFMAEEEKAKIKKEKAGLIKAIEEQGKANDRIRKENAQLYAEKKKVIVEIGQLRKENERLKRAKTEAETQLHGKWHIPSEAQNWTEYR